MLKRRKAILRTLENCKFYEKEELYQHLNNEIGVMRGIIYCGYIPLSKTERKEVYAFLKLAYETIMLPEKKEKIKRYYESND